MASLHLQPLPDVAEVQAIVPMPVVAVMQRSNGHWSPGAKVLLVTNDEMEAEAYAMHQKRQHPQQAFGVFMLRSEAREVKDPVEIVRLVE